MKSLGGEMVDTRDSKSRAKERGGSSPLQGIILSSLNEHSQQQISDLINSDIKSILSVDTKYSGDPHGPSLSSWNWNRFGSGSQNLGDLLDII